MRRGMHTRQQDVRATEGARVSLRAGSDLRMRLSVRTDGQLCMHGLGLHACVDRRLKNCETALREDVYSLPYLRAMVETCDTSG